MSLIEYEGRQIELPNEITANDEKLLEVLLPYFPELSSATIERKTGQPIKIIKQAKTKGVEEDWKKELCVLLTPHSPLPSLVAAPEEPNQAVQLTWALQYDSISGCVTPLTLASRAQELSDAIALGEQELQRFRDTLKKLQLAPAIACLQIPLNF